MVLIYLATFLSGSAALISQLLWTRSLSLILGSTVEAGAAVFAAFIFGLSLGAFAYSKYFSNFKNKLRLYSLAELGIGLSSLGISLFLFWGRNSFSDLIVHPNTDFYFLKTFTFVLMTVLIPTVLMGCTFPLLVDLAMKFKWLSDSSKIGLISRVYSMNVAGAGFGVLVTTFVLIPEFGILNSIYTSLIFNIASALLPLFFVTETFSTKNSFSDMDSVVPKVLSSPNEPSMRQLIGLVFLSGFISLSLQIVWIRFSQFFIGNRTYAFAILLFCILFSLFLGAQIGGYLLNKFRHNKNSLIRGTLFFSIVFIIIGTGFFSFLLQSKNRFFFEKFFSQIHFHFILYKMGLAFVLVGISFIALGCLLPICLSIINDSKQALEKSISQLYFWNSLGCAAGSLLTGFFAYHFLTSFQIIKALLIILSIALFLFDFTFRRTEILISTLSLIAFAIFYLPNSLTFLEPGETLLWEKENQYGAFKVSQYKNGWIYAANNNTYLVGALGRKTTSDVQEMQAQLGIYYFPKAQNALILGNGYGITAGKMASFPQINEVDTVEINPLMVEAGPLFSPYNYDYFKNPKINMIQDDGRHFLINSKKSYDIISLNLTDPHIPGIADLYNLEFIEIIKKHLSKNGICIVHVFGQDTDLILNTLAKALPYRAIFSSYTNEMYNVVLSAEPLRPRQDSAQSMLPIERTDIVVHTNLISTDNEPRLEFSKSGDAEIFLMSNE